MKHYNVKKSACEQGGEYVLGMKDLHTHACYLIYGVMEPGESGRIVKPGDGHEEILCAVTGPLVIHGEKGESVLEEGHAVHVKESEQFTISNPSETAVVYLMAGGHCRPHHH